MTASIYRSQTAPLVPDLRGHCSRAGGPSRPAAFLFQYAPFSLRGVCGAARSSKHRRAASPFYHCPALSFPILRRVVVLAATAIAASFPFDLRSAGFALGQCASGLRRWLRAAFCVGGFLSFAWRSGSVDLVDAA
ncbi:hypothetical protein Avi_6167 [Allorhizobium ampelinum S4]|uniref:Uncharacterized protein n=1 Tax=Allorhizobium ampelinum (strain ATCC BAA-846 / DSM 112012 / S4) TaxID=311402 RepID=B9K2R2_ALLAM|nr:hypothetical protein Avi_6167 [Allorhizobium ampelinum S4]